MRVYNKRFCKLYRMQYTGKPPLENVHEINTFTSTSYKHVEKYNQNHNFYLNSINYVWSKKQFPQLQIKLIK